ncbi:MAG: hypothetical protein ACQEUT_10285 [Bacillota bacterium]
MNITLFYKKISHHYFNRAIAMLLLAVLLSVSLRGFHIVFYLILILLGISCVFMYFIYDGEVRRSRTALRAPLYDRNGFLVVTRKNRSFGFFGFDGVMKASSSFQNGRWMLEMGDTMALLKKSGGKMEFSCQGDNRQFIKTGGRWKDIDGNNVSFIKRGEGWDLAVNEKKVCSIIHGVMPAQIQQLFDPSSVILCFEKVDDVHRILGILFVMMFLEEYYLI